MVGIIISHDAIKLRQIYVFLLVGSCWNYSLCPAQSCVTFHNKDNFLYSEGIVTSRLLKAFVGRPIQSNTILASQMSPLCIARYSLIQLRELDQCRVKQTCPKFDTAADDLNLVLLVKVRNSSYCASN